MVDIHRNQEPGGLELPPLFQLVRLRERGDAFAHACAIAPKAGAGTMVVTGRYDTIELALVLEPDEPLSVARRAFFLCMDALCNALALHVPPEKPLSIRWPDAVLLDGFVMGGGRLAWPQGTAEDAVPDWLVFGAEIAADIAADPDQVPMAMSLIEAGTEAVDRDAILGNFCRHLMNAVDLQAEQGFAAAARGYLERIERQKAGELLALAPNGDLLAKLHAAGQPERRGLLGPLAAPQWRDPATGEIRD